MLTTIHPKLPMRDRQATQSFYIDGLGFAQIGAEYEEYLMIRKDEVEIHFFLFAGLDPLNNYGQVYIRTNAIDKLYAEARAKNIAAPAHNRLEIKPWGQREFSLLDPDHNLLTFGQAI